MFEAGTISGFAALQETPLYRMPMRGRCDLRPVWRLARLLRQERFDLLHTHTPRSALIGRLATLFSGTPLVHHVHGQTAVEMHGRWWTRLMARVEQWSLARAAAVVAVSPSAADYMAEHGVDAARLRMVPNGGRLACTSGASCSQRLLDVGTRRPVAATQGSGNGARARWLNCAERATTCGFARRLV